MRKHHLLILLNAFAFTAFCQTGTRSAQSIGFNDVSIIELPGNGDVWAGSASQGIAFYKEAMGSWAYYDTMNTPQLDANNITAILAMGLDEVPHAIVGTSNGAVDFVDSNPVALLSLPETYVRGVVYRPDSLWIVTNSKLTRYDSSMAFKQSYNAPYPNITCTQHSLGQCGGLWAGTANSGCFYTSDAVNFTYIDTTPARQKLVDNRVNAIAVDNNCVAKFIGTKGGFSVCPIGNPCQNFTTANGLPQNDITAIATGCGKVWLATRDSGVVLFTPPATFARVTMANGLPDNNVTALAVNALTCTVYVGTADGNIAVVDTARNVTNVMTGIEKVRKEFFAVNVYPQPAGNSLNFVFESEIANGELNLTDINGRLVYFAQLKNATNADADVSALPQGLYFYQLYSNKQLIKTGKVQVVR